MIQHALRQLDSYIMFFKTVRISTSRGSISDLWALTTSPVVENTHSLGRGSRNGEGSFGEGRVKSCF